MAILVKGKTFTSTEQVTSTKLHQLIDSGTFDTGAVDGVTTALSGGAIIVKDGGITGPKLSSTVAIPTGATAVTQAVDTNTTAVATTAFAKKEADDAQAFSIQRANHTGTQAAGTITGLGALATTGTAAQICKAWCNFDGTLTGTNAPRSGFNVTSVTRNSTGNYTVNFTNPMGNIYYCVQTMCNSSSGGNSAILKEYSTATDSYPSGKTTSSIVLSCRSGTDNSTATDCASNNIVVFGD